MKYETWAPLFPGFYNTIFQYDESQDISDYNRQHETKLSYDDFIWDNEDYCNRIGKAFVKRLETELSKFLPVKIKFQNIVSPKEYNFKNDSINIEVSLSLPRLMKLIKEQYSEAKQYFIDNYSSCSGFISYHSNDIADWLNVNYILEKPDHRIGGLLSCLCWLKLDIEDCNLYYWIESDMYISFEPKESEEPAI